MIEGRVLNELETRRSQQIKRAVEKYGDEAMLDGGDPSREIVDYLVNELVGLRRYADMIMFRAQEYEDFDPELGSRALELMITVRTLGDQLAAAVIDLRQDLEWQGLLSGQPETPFNAFGEPEVEDV